MPRIPLIRLVPRSRRRRIALGVVLLLLLSVSVWVWRIVRVEDIPEQLEVMEEDPAAIVLESLTDRPGLALADQRGFTSFYVVVGMRNDSKEGIALNRALSRWEYPDNVRGYIVGDAEGAGVFRGIARKYIEFFRKETRFDIYVDFEGQMMRVFKLAKGHHGFVVLGPDGDVLARKSGGMEGNELESLRTLLGAEEPPPPPPAPEFDVGGLTKASCSARACALIFLGAPVRKADIPGVEGGFQGETADGMRLLDRPEVRLAATALKMDMKGAQGVLIGEVDTEVKGWAVVAADATARATFEIADDETAMVIVDEQGRLAFLEVGRIPMYKWGAAADLLGAEIMPGGDD